MEMKYFVAEYGVKNRVIMVFLNGHRLGDARFLNKTVYKIRLRSTEQVISGKTIEQLLDNITEFMAGAQKFRKKYFPDLTTPKELPKKLLAQSGYKFSEYLCTNQTISTPPNAPYYEEPKINLKFVLSAGKTNVMVINPKTSLNEIRTKSTINSDNITHMINFVTEIIGMLSKSGLGKKLLGKIRLNPTSKIITAKLWANDRTFYLNCEYDRATNNVTIVHKLNPSKKAQLNND